MSDRGQLFRDAVAVDEPAATARAIHRDVSRQIKIWKRTGTHAADVAKDLRCFPSWQAVRATAVAMQLARYGIVLPTQRRAA